MSTNRFADVTTPAAPTNDDLTDATIDQTTQRIVTSTEDARDGSHRRAAIIETKTGDQSGLGTSRRLSTTGSATTATSVNQLQQKHRSINKYSGASR